MADCRTDKGITDSCTENDGLKNQVVLLQEISRKLDDYFTNRHLGSGSCRNMGRSDPYRRLSDGLLELRVMKEVGESNGRKNRN
jgi:hypothetical protein